MESSVNYFKYYYTFICLVLMLIVMNITVCFSFNSARQISYLQSGSGCYKELVGVSSPLQEKQNSQSL